jgi:hypothetical protein
MAGLERPLMRPPSVSVVCVDWRISIRMPLFVWLLLLVWLSLRVWSFGLPS